MHRAGVTRHRHWHTVAGGAGEFTADPGIARRIGGRRDQGQGGQKGVASQLCRECFLGGRRGRNREYGGRDEIGFHGTLLWLGLLDAREWSQRNDMPVMIL